MVDKINSFQLQVVQSQTSSNKVRNIKTQEPQNSISKDQIPPSSNIPNKGSSETVVNFIPPNNDIPSQVNAIKELTQKDLEILGKFNVGIVKSEGNYYFTINGKISSPDEVYRHLQTQKIGIKKQLTQTKQEVDNAVQNLNQTVSKNWNKLTLDEQSSVKLQLEVIVTPNYRAFNIRYEMINNALDR